MKDYSSLMPNRYGPKAGEKVHKAMHKMEEGKLKMGKSGKKVTSRKQAIAIGLSEAKKEGARLTSTKRNDGGQGKVPKKK